APELLRRAAEGPQGNGHHRHLLVHGQRPPDHRVQPQRDGKPQADRPRREGRDDRGGVVMPIKQMIADAQKRMDASLETVRRELAALRTGRASLGMLDGVRVDYYGTPTPINQVGNVQIPDPTLITIQPWDPKILPVIEKAIRGSDLDLNPQNDGKIIRIPIPSLTEERRKVL